MGMLLDLQLNERAYLVSVVATIFVPLTFVTGFFGMNFGWMVDHIDSPIAFWLLGDRDPDRDGGAVLAPLRAPVPRSATTRRRGAAEARSAPPGAQITPALAAAARISA